MYLVCSLKSTSINTDWFTTLNIACLSVQFVLVMVEQSTFIYISTTLQQGVTVLVLNSRVYSFRHFDQIVMFISVMTSIAMCYF